MSGMASWATVGGCGAQSIQGPGHGRTVGPGVVHTFVGSGSIHKLVAGSLCPHKIIFPSILRHTSCYQIRLCILLCTVGECQSGMLLLVRGQCVHSKP